MVIKENHLQRYKQIAKLMWKYGRLDLVDQMGIDDALEEFLEAHTEKGKKYRLLDVLEEFRITIKNELNYERDVQNLVSMGKILDEFELIQVPQPVPDYTTRRVLTMDYVSGRKITTP